MTKVHQQLFLLVQFIKDGDALLPCGSDLTFSDNSVVVGGLDTTNHFSLAYFPPLPIDINQFGSAWWNEYWDRAFSSKYNLSSLGISNLSKSYLGPVYDSNALVSGNISFSNLLLGGLISFDYEIETQFEPLFDGLNSMIQLCSNLIVSGINNIIPELRLIKTALDTLDIDVGDVSITTDDITTQLQNIYTILASQNANQAAISSAINNKDNQSNISNALYDLFTFKTSNNDDKYSVFTGNSISGFNSRNFSLATSINRVRQCFEIDNNQVYNSTNPSSKFLRFLQTFCSADFTSNIPLSTIKSSSFLKIISDKLGNIETKLEQNLPFTTIVENEIVETNVSQNCNYSSKIEQIPFSE